MAFFKRENEDRGRAPATSPRDRMLIGAVITVALVIVAAFVLVTNGSGTPLSRCTSIVLQQQRSSCLLSLANSTTNASVCSYLPKGQETQCVSNVAIITRNTSACGSNNANESAYSQCAAAVGEAALDISYCAQAGEPFRSQCSYYIAAMQNFQQASYCSTIGNATLSTACMERSDYKSALKLGSLAYCTALPDTLNSSLLSYMLSQGTAETGISNITAYAAFINVTPRQFCSYSVAVLTRNSSVCPTLGGTPELLCNSAFYAESYNSTNNITQQNISTICGKLPSYVQQVCSFGLLSYIAVRDRNVTVCGQIGAGTYQNACYSSLAAKYHDNQYCSYINNYTIMAACESGAATANSTG